MREGTATVIHRLDYAPPAYRIREVELTFDLDPAKTIVASRLRIERDAALLDDGSAPALRLHGEDLNLLRVSADGESVSFRHEHGMLVIDHPPAAQHFLLEIRNTVAPDKNTHLSGLYTSASGFFTQCEAEGFRRITYFQDRPDVMAVFTVTLRADKQKYPVLLSNGNLLEEAELPNGRHMAKWHDPFPKPSYLFALVAADLVSRQQRITSRAGQNHLLQIYVNRGDLEKTEHAMNSLIASIAWDEARFGLTLDLERYMIVAVADYNMGAMENKGLNIFNTKAVLASAATSTDDDFAAIESIVGHEYFHNWTGNRVTCRDWFQLSLKEGLTVFRDQEFSMDMAHEATARAVKRIEDVRSLRMVQFTEDAGPMAHPVRPDAYAAIDNFYTTTIYEKGAEVVRMMHSLVGREGFRAGMDLYFQRHDGQAVTCDDFAQAIADANPESALTARLEAFKRWYAQAGTPRLQSRAAFDAEARRVTLTLTQTALPSPGQAKKQPFVIPVRAGLVQRGGGAAAAEQLLVLDGSEQSFVFEDVDFSAGAPVPSVLRGFSAPVVLDDGLGDDDLLVLLAHDSDAFNRWEAGQRLALRRMVAALDGPEVPAPLDDAFVGALREVLRHADLAPAFKDLALTLPGEQIVAEHEAAAGRAVDPARIHAVREHLRAQLAECLHADWLWAWHAHPVTESYAPTPAQAGRRALANHALGMLCLQAVRSGDATWPGRAYQRVKDAPHMTDRLGALTALINAHADLTTPALAHFLAQAHGDALVIDKWFQAQARAPEAVPGVHTVPAGSSWTRVKALLQHPAFTLKNPNRARSLLSNLFLFNPGVFHRADAAGYVLWADKLIEADALNPQVAARLARAMDRWAVLAEPGRSAARLALERVAARSELSADTREVVSRALEAAP